MRFETAATAVVALYATDPLGVCKKIFLAHARKDDNVARRLAERLQQCGFDVWDAQDQIVPGDNWAKKIGAALDNSDLLLILLTPGAIKSDGLRRDIEFAIGSKKYANRVYTVMVGPTFKAQTDIPWILLKLPHMQVESAAEFDAAVDEIQELASSLGSGSHA